MPKDIVVFCKQKKIVFQYQPTGKKTSINIDDINFAFNNLLTSEIYYTPYPERLLTEFSSFFNLTEAAGGIVVNEHNEWLMIHRLGFWDLPKGKIDEQENIIDTAVREIHEECNVSVTKKNAMFLGATCHIYEENKQRILKRTYWYMFFTTNNKEHLIPQTSENINKVEWINLEKWNKIKLETYPLITNLIEQTSLII